MSNLRPLSRFARLSLLPETKPQSAGSWEELEALERLISTHRELLRQVTSYPNRKLKRPDFLPYDTTHPLADPLLFPEPRRSLSSSSSASGRSGPGLKPLQELCNSYFLSLMKEQLAEAERRLRGDRSLLRSARLSRALSKPLGPVDFLFELCPEDGGEEAELEAGVKSADADDLLRSGPTSLESFFSCVEELPIKLEAEEVAEPTPGQDVAMEMAGSVSSSDSIEVLGTERSYRLQQGVAASHSRGTGGGVTPPTRPHGDFELLLFSSETPPVTTDATHRRAAAEGGVRHACARRENSEDSIEVLSTTDSIFPDDLTAIAEEEAEPHLQSNGLEEEEEAPEAAGPGNHGGGDRPDDREPPGPEDEATRMSRIWRGSDN